MRVVIEVVAGPLTGRRFHLVRNQRLEVGSTARADVCVRGDSSLAGQHFALETDFQVCRIHDLSGQAATLVNGQAVESAVVRSGDQVQAGVSRFIIHVEGDAANAPPEFKTVAPARAPAQAAARRAADARFTAIVCDTGLTRYAGDCRTFPPGELAAALATEWPLYLLADNRRLSDETLAALSQPQYLFDWLGEAAASVSPLILGPEDIAEPAALIDRGFGKDGLVAFFAREADAAAIDSLRSSCRIGQDRVVGICWPRILAHLLSRHDPDFVKRLMAPFPCVLLEDPAAPAAWQVFSSEPLEQQLQTLGLRAATTTA